MKKSSCPSQRGFIPLKLGNKPLTNAACAPEIRGNIDVSSVKDEIVHHHHDVSKPENKSEITCDDTAFSGSNISKRAFNIVPKLQNQILKCAISPSQSTKPAISTTNSGI
jgi:hypothetical protein